MAGRSSIRRRWRGAAAIRGVAVAVIMLLALALASCATQANGPWQNLGPGDSSIVLSLAADPHEPQLLYAGTDQGQVLRTRTDANASEPGAGLPAEAVVPGLAADPHHDGVVFAGTSSGLYETTDFGDHWQPHGSGLPRGDTVGALAFIPSSAATLYAGTQEHGVYLSQDDGTTWTPLDAGLPAHANVYALAYDPATSKVFVGLSGGPGVFAIGLGQTAWSAHNSGLPAQGEIFALLPMAAHGSAPVRLYVGTSQGVYVSVDGGESWSASGLSGARVLSLASDVVTPGGIYAGTDSGVFRAADGQGWQSVAPGIQQKVAALLTRTDTAGKVIIFAGAGNILRYPARVPPASSAAGAVFSLVLLALVVAVLVYITRRHVRILGELEARTRPREGVVHHRQPHTLGGRALRRPETSDGSADGAQHGHDAGQLPRP